MFERYVDAISAIAGSLERARKRHTKLYADKAYNPKLCSTHLTQQGNASRIARQGIEEARDRTITLYGGEGEKILYRLGKLRIRIERLQDIHEALLNLMKAIMCALRGQMSKNTLSASGADRFFRSIGLEIIQIECIPIHNGKVAT